MPIGEVRGQIAEVNTLVSIDFTGGGFYLCNLTSDLCNILFQVIEEIILRQLADGGQRGLGVDPGLGEIGGGRRQVRSV